MAKKNSLRKIVGLVSTVTKHRIYTTKNTKNNPDPIEKMAFDPLVGKHVLYKEQKKVNLGRNVVKPRKN